MAGNPLGRALFRLVLREAKAYDAARLPLLGLAAMPQPRGLLSAMADGVLSPSGLARACFDARRGMDEQRALDDGITAITKLQQQRSILIEADLEGHKPLECWHRLLSLLGRERLPPGGAASMQAVERGALLVARLCSPPPDSFLLDDEAEESARAQQSAEDEAVVKLGDIAESARSRSPSLYTASGVLGGGGAGRLERALEDVRWAVHECAGLKGEWPEYMWDGLRHVLLPEVLKGGAGTPVALGAVYLGVGARIGLPLGAVAGSFPRDGRGEGVDVGGLPAHLAAKVEAQTSGAGTAPDACVLRVVAEGTAMFVDPFKGRLLDETGAAELLRAGAGRAGWQEVASPVAWYVSMVRAVLQARQRRGESEDSIAWIYQVMALHPSAAEWQEILRLKERL